MTDKELFEKTEKAFNIKNKNTLVERVYKKGNFKRLLEEEDTNTSPVKSNYGDNSVSAARAAGRGVATVAGTAGKGVGAAARGLGKFGNFLKGVIPGTNTNRRKKAETRRLEAQAKQEEIKARQNQQDQMGYDKPKTEKEQYKPGDFVLVNTTQGKRRGNITELLPDGTAQFQQKGGPKYMIKQTDIIGKVKVQDQLTKQPAKQPAVKFKVGDEVFVRTTKNPKAEGIVTALLDDTKPGSVQVKLKNSAPYAFDKRNVSLKREINS